MSLKTALSDATKIVTRIKSLSGPNSARISLTVDFHWESIKKLLRKKAPSWKAPQSMPRAWKIDKYIDYVSGLEILEKQYIGGPDHGVDHHSTDSTNKYFFTTITSRNTLPEKVWEYESLLGRMKNGSFIVGFHADNSLDKDWLDPTKTIADIRLEEIHGTLICMDKVFLGASARFPLTLDRETKYGSVTYDGLNPYSQSHVFLNSCLSVYIRYQAFRGMFTQVDDYREDEHKKRFVRNFYGVTLDRKTEGKIRKLAVR